MAATLKCDTIQNASSATANITLDTAGNATVGNTLAMGSSFLRNRIINGDMRIDQRNAGASFSSGVAVVTYGLDRFYIYSAGAAVTGQRVNPSLTGFPNALRVTGAAGSTYAEIGQRIESVNIADLAGSTVTVSFWAASSTATSITVYANYANTQDNFAASTGIGSTAVSITSTLARYTVSFALPSQAANGVVIAFSFGAGLTSGTFTITGVQLEVGSVATPFERRLYGQELALCQRYYQAFNGLTGFWDSGTTIGMTVVNKVNMRATPTYSLTTTSFSMECQGIAPLSTTTGSISSTRIGSQGANIFVAGFSGATTYRYGWQGDMTVNILNASAEL